MSLIHADDKQAMQTWMENCAAGKRPGALEFRINTPDGDVRYIYGYGELQYDAEDRPCGLTGIAKDITERKRAEEEINKHREHLEELVEARTRELGQKETFLRAVYENVGSAIFVVNVNELGRFQYAGWNSVGERVTGIKSDQAIGRSPEEVFAPIIASRICERYSKCVLEGLQDYEEVFTTNKGKRWSHTKLTPLKDDAGRVIQIVGLSTNITERKNAENALRIAAAAFEASQDGMIITDPNGVILRVNQAFTEITGYSAEEAVGQTSRFLKSGRHDADFYAEMWGTLLETGSWQGEIWDRRKNGEVYPKWLRITGVRAADGTVTHFVAVHSDITERKAAEDAIKILAFYDPLTQLPNRRLLMDRLRQTLAASIRSGREGALLFIDMDDFKTVNDTLGHDKGDLLLQEVARRLSTCIREGDTVARLGGDEFVVMLEGLNEIPGEAATQAETVGAKILAALGKAYVIAGHEIRSTPSIGITLFADQRENIDELVKQADIAMYQAKSAGRNGMCFFDPDLQVVIQARTAMETDLRHGIEDGQLILHYQPQVEGRRVIGAEALIRWRHPQRGMVPPVEFIPLAEETGLILPLGLWVLETACTQIAAWADRAETADLALAVNVSARQLRQTDFVEEVLSVVERTNSDPRKLKLELTESMLVDNVEEIIAKMNALRSHGIRFSLDDFGTGYSSLSYLKRLPLSQLKIDRSFVMDVLTDPNDAAIARTVIALGQSLGLKVIAEGVETEAQREFLAEHGCLAYQGYLFSKPVPAEEFEKLVAAMPEQKSFRSAMADVVSGLRIMVIEDEPTILMALQLLLEGWNCKVLCAASGEEALVTGEQERWCIDAIIADHRLGAGMSGTQTAAEFGRRSGRPIPTLIVTGDTASERIEEIRASGFELIHKPVSSEELARRIAHVLLWG